MGVLSELDALKRVNEQRVPSAVSAEGAGWWWGRTSILHVSTLYTRRSQVIRAGTGTYIGACGDSALARRLHSLSRTCNKWTASVYVTLRVIRKGVYEVVQRVLVLFLKVRSIGTNE